MLITVGRFIYTKYWGILYVEHCGKIYWHTILRNTLCWTLGRFIYTKYWGILYFEHCEKIYLLKILRNTVCWTLGRFIIYTHNTEEYTVCWTLWKDLFTQNTEEYCTLDTVGKFIYTKYWGILYIEHWEDLFTQILRNTVCWTLRRFIYIKYWGILYAEHCGKIYLHKILRNTVCWTLWEDLFTQNTEEYFMLNTVGKCIYTKYWGILYVEHWEDLFTQILGTTLCWALVGDLFTQNTGDYLKLNTVGMLT
jgi:hypothetical protein